MTMSNLISLKYLFVTFKRNRPSELEDWLYRRRHVVSISRVSSVSKMYYERFTSRHIATLSAEVTVPGSSAFLFLGIRVPLEATRQIGWRWHSIYGCRLIFVWPALGSKRIHKYSGYSGYQRYCKWRTNTRSSDPLRALFLFLSLSRSHPRISLLARVTKNENSRLKEHRPERRKKGKKMCRDTVWVYGRRCHNSGLHRMTGVYAPRVSSHPHTQFLSRRPSLARNVRPLTRLRRDLGPSPTLQGAPVLYSSFLPLTHSLSKKLNSWLVSAHEKLSRSRAAFECASLFCASAMRVSSRHVTPPHPWGCLISSSSSSSLSSSSSSSSSSFSFLWFSFNSHGETRVRTVVRWGERAHRYAGIRKKGVFARIENAPLDDAGDDSSHDDLCVGRWQSLSQRSAR